MRPRRVFALLLALALAAALIACGGAAPAANPIAATTATTTPTTASVSSAVSSAAAPTPATDPTVTPTATATPSPTATVTPTPRPTMAVSPGAARYAIVPEESRATYEVGERFFGREINVTVATTSAVSGDLYIDRQRPSASSVGAITVDLRQLRSDLPGHDDARNEFIGAARHPTATFTPKRLEGLPDTPYTEGQELRFTIVGDLTIRAVTKEVTFDASGTIAGATFTGAATARIRISDFGLRAPSALGRLEVDDNVNLILTIVARRQP